jgi:hypothetical protein
VCSHIFVGGVLGVVIGALFGAFLGVGVRGRGWGPWARSIWSQPTATRAPNARDAMLWPFFGPCLGDVNSDGSVGQGPPQNQ